MSIRIGGLISGMDIDSIVKQMLSGQTAKIDRQKQKKQILEWQRDSYRETNMKLLAFRNSMSDLKLPSTFTGKKAESSDETVLNVTATSDAESGTHIIKVNSLMSGVTRITTEELAAYKDTLAEQFGISGTVSFTLKGKDGVSHDYSFDTASKSIGDVVNAINDNAATSGINAGYSEGGNRFVLATADKGADQVINLEADPDSFIKTTLKLGMDPGEYKGTDASIDYDGAANIVFKSNQFTLNNINFNLKKAGETAAVTISQNVDAAVDKIKAFVEAYNQTIENINVKLNERREYDKSSHSFKYQPLTDEQKEDMSEKQIEQWEENAKKGIMNHESLLQNLVANLRMTTTGILSNSSTLKIIEPQVTLVSQSGIAAYDTTLAAQFGLAGTVSFTLQGKDGGEKVYNFDADTANINDVANAINANTYSSGIRASYSAASNTFTLATLDQDTELQIVSDSNSFLADTLKLGQETGANIGNGLYTAKSNLLSPTQDVKYARYMSLESIGITTSDYITGSKDNGKLTINEDKLREALQDNPEDVMELFNMTQTVYEDGNYVTYNVGIGLKLYDNLTNAMQSLTDKAGSESAIYDNSFLTNNIVRVDDRINTLLDHMKNLEDRYYRQFAAMEKVVQRGNEQMAWLSQKLGADSQ
ncbi:MAG: flagellar filament capping protein FliD [Syntrophomonas sp.]|nr:flagellar filament capping protein FliD [Syntrophomonas sp.]